MSIGLGQKSVSFDEHRLHAVRKTLSGRVQDGHIAFSFDCFLREHQSGLDIRLETDVGEDEINPFSTFKHGECLVECTRGKRSMANVLKYSLCENSDLILVFHYQY